MFNLSKFEAALQRPFLIACSVRATGCQVGGFESTVPCQPATVNASFRGKLLSSLNLGAFC